MCRIYKSKKGNYIRLCCRLGFRKGAHIYFTGEPPLSSSGHYLMGRERGKTGSEKLHKRVCVICGSPAVSRHEIMCQPCRNDLLRKEVK